MGVHATAPPEAANPPAAHAPSGTANTILAAGAPGGRGEGRSAFLRPVAAVMSGLFLVALAVTAITLGVRRIARRH